MLHAVVAAPVGVDATAVASGFVAAVVAAAADDGGAEAVAAAVVVATVVGVAVATAAAVAVAAMVGVFADATANGPLFSFPAVAPADASAMLKKKKRELPMQFDTSINQPWPCRPVEHNNYDLSLASRLFSPF